MSSLLLIKYLHAYQNPLCSSYTQNKYDAIKKSILPFTGGGTTKKTGKKKQEKTVSPEGQISDDDLLRLMGGE